jgi:hypothetical protein
VTHQRFPALPTTRIAELLETQRTPAT